MPTRIRLGAVNYLNTKPLIYRLKEDVPEVDLVLDVPSRLADRMAKGQLDVALIPVIEYFRAENYRVIPDISIASQGPVLSVTLFSRRPWGSIRSVALDEGSRTSVALTKILLGKRQEIKPEFVPLPLEARPEELDTDAVLLIGDRAMKACLPGYEHAYDLGREWHQSTGLPFVYAFWAVRPGVNLGNVPAILQRAKQIGCRHVGHIAQKEATALGLDAGFCRRYLETLIVFDLGPREMAGLEVFYEMACELGLAPKDRTVQLYEPELVGSCPP